jgi:hypothetical protein
MTKREPFDYADLTLRVSLIARIAGQFTHELAYGMWNPDYCSADPGMAGERFLEAIEPHLKQIRDRRGRIDMDSCGETAPGKEG